MKNSTTPLYKQIRNTIRSQILSGQLPDGFKLPSERQLVQRLGVHRNTVKKAYGMLIAEGLIYASSKAPRGYFVRNSPSEVKPDGRPDTRKAFSSLDKNFNYHFLGTQNTFQRLYNSSYLSDAIPFAGVLVNRETLPLSYLHEIMGEITAGDDLELFWFCDPQGTERMRTDLASMLFERKIYVQPQNIQIINETYEALSNIAFMYLKEGDFAIVEEPALPAIVNILLHTGAHVLFVPVE
ncbi:MAG: GntR family transcriptional regulator, partial [Clostridia bacterium]|nr:GntR family transcriptional regulator [Clostridia bacterium]